MQFDMKFYALNVASAESKNRIREEKSIYKGQNRAGEQKKVFLKVEIALGSKKKYF